LFYIIYLFEIIFWNFIEFNVILFWRFFGNHHFLYQKRLLIIVFLLIWKQNLRKQYSFWTKINLMSLRWSLKMGKIRISLLVTFRKLIYLQMFQVDLVRFNQWVLNSQKLKYFRTVNNELFLFSLNLLKWRSDFIF
jgi:hypothetical protein